MVCVTIKFQKCGKENCHCSSEFLHGPYYWLITYKKRSRRKKGKYIWIYLGKNAQTIKESITSHVNTSHWTDQEWKDFQTKMDHLEEKSKEYSNTYTSTGQKKTLLIK